MLAGLLSRIQENKNTGNPCEQCLDVLEGGNNGISESAFIRRSGRRMACERSKLFLGNQYGSVGKRISPHLHLTQAHP